MFKGVTNASSHSVHGFIMLIHAHTFSNDTESEVSTSLTRVLMGYLKRRVFRQHLKVSIVAESLMLRGNTLQTVGAK